MVACNKNVSVVWIRLLRDLDEMPKSHASNSRLENEKMKRSGHLQWFQVTCRARAFTLDRTLEPQPSALVNNLRYAQLRRKVRLSRWVRWIANEAGDDTWINWRTCSLWRDCYDSPSTRRP
jgi:hypothetical protein